MFDFKLGLFNYEEKTHCCLVDPMTYRMRHISKFEDGDGVSVGNVGGAAGR